MTDKLRVELTRAEAEITYNVLSLALTDPDWWNKDSYTGHQRNAADRAVARFRAALTGEDQS